MPQDHPTDNPILNAARRELAERAKATAPLCTANDAYNGPARIVSINTSAHKGTRKSPVADGHDTVIEQFGLASDAHAGHWQPPGFLFSCRVYPDGAGARARCARGRLWRELHNPGHQSTLAPLGHTAQAWKRRARRNQSDRQGLPHPLCHLLSRATVSFPTRAFSAWCYKAEKPIPATTYRWSSSAMAPVPSLPPTHSKRWSRLVAKEPCSCKIPR